jgi:hypothetical protein
MAKTKKATSASTKKQWREKVAAMLENQFRGLKKSLGDKKFGKNIRKASKIMVAGTPKKAKPAATIKKATA